MLRTQTYSVRGMTCGHCARAVTAELEELDAVTGVSVDLDPDGDSTITVATSAQLADEEVREAVQRAGYEVVGSG